MGGTDAKDILGLPKTPLSLSHEKKSRPQKESHRKPDGISREVYALTGGVAPLMPSIDVTHLKRRPPPDEKVAWQWLPIKSSARNDDLQLYHWVRVVNGVPPTADYSFAKYNKSVDILKYTDDEYENHLTDPVWTKEETDQLFELCERFDLRFTVIADRFPLPRTVEELKDRYYSVTRALLRARAQSPADVANHPLMKEPYDISRDRERKRALSMVLSQSRHQEKKDAEILAEAKRITEMRLAARRATDLDVSGNENVGLDKADGGPGCSVSPSSNSQLPATAVAPSTLTMADYASTLASLRMLHVYLRTYGLEQMVQAASSAVGLRTIKRVEQTLQDLGVNLKPKVPTKTVCDEHLELRKEILTLLNLQKQLQYKESEGSSHREGTYAAMPDTPKDRVFASEPFSFGVTIIFRQLFPLSGPIPKVHRSDESPPLQRRRSFPFPLKQPLSLSMVLMVTPFPSRFRPPPDPPPPDLPPWSLCKSRPFKARFLIIPPEPLDVPLLLAPLLQTLESSINPVVFLPRCSSPVLVAVASPLRFFASTIGLTGTVFVSFGVCVSTAWYRFQHSSSFQLEPQFIFAETSSLLVKLSKGIVSVSSWNKSYLYEPCLVLGVSCLEMSPLPLNEDIALPLNLILPQFEDVASDRSLPLYEDVASNLLSLPLYEDVTLCSPPLVPQYGVGTRTFVLLALVSMVSGTDASKNGGLGWCIHGMDEAHDARSSARILYVVSTLAAEALTLQVALPSASSAGFSKLQEIWDSIVLFSALHSGMDLNENAGISAERTIKKEPKRKGPGRQADTPSPAHKRPRKLKASDL